MARLPVTISLIVSVALSASHAAELPDLLQTQSGTRVSSSVDWEQVRRPELIELFRAQVYGRAPVGRPASLSFEPQGEGTPAFDGTALRKRVRIAYTGPGGEGAIPITCFYPASGEIKGCFVLIVNRSRRIIDEAEQNPAEFWPVREVLARGYATVAFHNSDVARDKADDRFTSGVFGVFGPTGDARPADAWATIAAWSWGASRVLDYLETEPRLKGVPVALVGHSRGGKAALWCGAQDVRVALTISNNSGCSGAALARGTTGETVKVINERFPHWFPANYHGYGDRVGELPVDQHALLALMAPRPVYVASSSEDANADPRAEFRACVEAAPAFALYKLSGVGAHEFPAPGEARHSGAIGYHLRAGEHNLTKWDWARFLDYADAHLRADR